MNFQHSKGKNQKAAIGYFLSIILRVLLAKPLMSLRTNFRIEIRKWVCALSDAGAIATQGHGATGWGPHEIKIKACLKTISSLEVLYKIKQKNKFFLWVLEQCYLHIAISSCWQLKKKKKKVLEATALLKIRFSFFTWPNISVLSAMLEKCIFQDKVKVDLNVQPKK